MQGLSHIAIFLNYLFRTKGYANNTIVSYSSDLEQFKVFLDNNEYESISFENVIDADIQAFIKCLQDQKYSEASLARKFACIGSFYKHLLKRKIINFNPTLDIERPKNKRPKNIIYLSEKEIDKLLCFPYDNHNFFEVRDQAIIEIFYYSGIKINELTALNEEDIDLKGWLMTLRDRKITIDKKIVKILRTQYLPLWNKRAKIDEKALFINKYSGRLTIRSISRIIDKRTKLVGLSIKKITPSSLRHTFVKNVINKGWSNKYLTEYLGYIRRESVYNAYKPLMKKRHDNA